MRDSEAAMNVVSIRAEFAWPIVFGLKTIEYRSWRVTPGKYLVHSSGSAVESMALDEMYDLAFLAQYLVDKKDGGVAFEFPDDIDKKQAQRVIEAHQRAYEICGQPLLLLGGVIIGWMQVAKVVQAGEREYHWHISNADVFEKPIQAKGRLRVWKFRGVAVYG